MFDSVISVGNWTCSVAFFIDSVSFVCSVVKNSFMLIYSLVFCAITDSKWIIFLADKQYICSLHNRTTFW